MPYCPKTIYSRLSPENQLEIRNNITLICREITNAKIRTDHKPTPSSQGDDLRETVKPSSSSKQPREPRITVRS